MEFLLNQMRSLNKFILPLIAGSALWSGSAHAATTCNPSILSSCDKQDGNVIFSNFQFSGGYIPDGTETFNLNGAPTPGNAAGSVSLSWSPAKMVSTSGTFTYTATLIGATFRSAQANITGETLEGSSLTTNLSSTGLPTSATSEGGAGTSRFFSPLNTLTTQTFSQQFGFTYVAGGSDGFTQVGGSWNTNPPLTIAVPGPLPLLGAATAFGLSRKLRTRIRSAV